LLILVAVIFRIVDYLARFSYAQIRFYTYASNFPFQLLTPQSLKDVIPDIRQWLMNVFSFLAFG